MTATFSPRTAAGLRGRLSGRVVLPGEQDYEGPLPSSPAPSWMHLMNLLMLVELNGRERTIDEYASLLSQAGYRLERTVPTSGAGWGYPWTVIEAIRQ